MYEQSAASSRPQGPPANQDIRTAPTADDTVVHVVTRYQRGGSERRIRDIVAALPELRHELLVGADSDIDLARRQVGAASVTALPALVRQVSPRTDAGCLLTLRRLLRLRRPALLVTHQSKAGALGRLAATGTGVPVVHSLSMASFGPGYGRLESAVFRRLERLLGARTAGFAVVGADLAARFAAVGVPADRLHVVRSLVPLPVPDALAARPAVRAAVTDRLGIPADGPLVAYVGSLDPRKNVLALPEVLARAGRRAGVAPAFVAAGAGPLQAALGDRLRTAGLADRSVLTGHLADPQDVSDVIRAADVVVLLSRAEGLPQVLVQAAAHGTPFVAYDVEGVAELLTLGALGFAVPIDDEDGAVTALSRLLAVSGTTDLPVADLTSWAPDAVHAGHREVVLGALGRPVTSRPADEVVDLRRLPAAFDRDGRLPA